MVGAIWLLASRWPAQPAERARVRMAADIQEQFDTEVLGLPWNGIKGDRVVPYKWVAARRRHLARDGERRLDALSEWYPDTGSLSPPLDALACQEINASWNAKVHGEVATLAIGLLVALVSAGIAVALAGELRLAEYLVAIVLPSTPALVEVTDTIEASRQQAAGWASVERAIDRAWDDDARVPGSVTVAHCRAIQDEIWELRRSGAPVPDWYYKLRRRAHHDDVAEVSASLRAGGEMT